MEYAHWIIILCIVFLSGIVKGTTGFGFALFALPLLVHFIPIKTLVPILTLFNLFSSAQIVIQTRKVKISRSIFLLSFAGIAGVIIGSLLLKFLPEKWLKLLAAVFLIVLSILFLTGYRFKIRKIRRGNIIAGLVSGFLGGSTSVSGPPLALFLTSLKLDTKHFRFTFAWYSIITAVVAMLDYLKIGLVYTQTFTIFFISLPVLIISIELGKIISKKISQHVFYTGSIIITLLAGLLMLVLCLGECMGWKF
ncbi:MAG: sulfite exporter TauE/SafE family protein [Bacteroidales bacterium]|nr:sulfite exporter TauE/SafE family protein [Bacteroidales bacterium]